MAAAAAAGPAKKAAAKKTTAKAATVIAEGGGPEDPITDAIAAKEALGGRKKTPAAAPAPAAGGGGGPKGSVKGPAVSKPKKAVGWALSGNRKLLTAEFIACMAVLGLGTVLAPSGSKDGIPRAMIKGSALCGLFLLLALVASAGKSSAKAATAIGTLVTAGYVLTSSDVHNVAKWTAAFFSKTGDVTAAQPTGAPVSEAAVASTTDNSAVAQG